MADQACCEDYASTDPLMTVSVLTNAATHELKCDAARSLLRGDCAAAPTTNVVHQITVAARCVPEELAGAHEAAAANTLRVGATVVAQSRVEQVAVGAAALISPSGQPAAQTRSIARRHAKAAGSRHPARFLPSMVRKELPTRITRGGGVLPPA